MAVKTLQPSKILCFPKVTNIISDVATHPFICFITLFMFTLTCFYLSFWSSFFFIFHSVYRKYTSGLHLYLSFYLQYTHTLLSFIFPPVILSTLQILLVSIFISYLFVISRLSGHLFVLFSSVVARMRTAYNKIIVSYSLVRFGVARLECQCREQSTSEYKTISPYC